MDIIAELRSALPPVFRGSKIGELTGYSIAWGTVQNKRSRGEIPDEREIFMRSGNRVLVARDPFLDWWATTLSEARRPSILPPRRGRRRIGGEDLGLSARRATATGRARDRRGAARSPPLGNSSERAAPEAAGTAEH
jgi:hypothetical protein